MIIDTYVFNPADQTITFPFEVQLSRFGLIVNSRTNVVIYQFNLPSKGGSVVGTVLTLTYNTTLMASTDKLQIFYSSTSLLSPGILKEEKVRMKVAATGKDIGDPLYLNPDGTYKIAAIDYPVLQVLSDLLEQTKLTNLLLLSMAVASGCSIPELEYLDIIKKDSLI